MQITETVELSNGAGRLRFLVLHGPNTNLFGRRETNIYGLATLEFIADQIRTLAAELGVEAMPLEGFDPTSVDKGFKIRETGHTTTVLLALGYPDLTKVYTDPISRFEADRLFTFV